MPVSSMTRSESALVVGSMIRAHVSQCTNPHQADQDLTEFQTRDGDKSQVSDVFMDELRAVIAAKHAAAAPDTPNHLAFNMTR